MEQCILATGGAGYIGSHVVTSLLEAGFRVVVLDNFENSDPEVLDRIEEITGRAATLVEGDVRDRALLDRLFREHRIDAVIHLAGKKAVGESVADPLLYYEANLNGAISLFGAMAAAGVKRLVFSSSATVYGLTDQLPISETCRTSTTNPYGRTKLVIEEMIEDCVAAQKDFASISLRYFNPVGAHESHLIGEDPKGVPTNLFPIITQAALGLRERVEVFGSDYDTADGSGLRDFIHVCDLAAGHLAAIRFLLRTDEQPARHRRINLGTGSGLTVLQVIQAFSRTCGFAIPHRLAPRRPGDVAASVADPTYAQQLLGWRATRGVKEMCADQWAFASRASDPEMAPRVAGTRFLRIVGVQQVAAPGPESGLRRGNGAK